MQQSNDRDSNGRDEVRSVTVLELQAQCLELVSEVVDNGSEVVITRGGLPVSPLVPFRKKLEAPFGRDRDIIQIHADIIEPIDMEWEADSKATGFHRGSP